MLNNLSATGKFTIRDARPSDGEFIARNVLAAMGYEVFNVDADSAIEFGSTSLNVKDAVKLVGEICARTRHVIFIRQNEDRMRGRQCSGIADGIFRR